LPGSPRNASARRGPSAATWVRIVLGVLGLCALAAIVHHVGFDLVMATLRPALAWLPLLCLLELGRIGSETAGAYVAYGARARQIPLATLFRANLVGQAIANLAPAPRLVNETIKATLLAPYVGVPTATAVGFTIQAATLISIGLFSIPCAAAIYVLGGASIWLWAALVHVLVHVGAGVALRAMTRARGPGRWLAQKFPRIAPGTAVFNEHSGQNGLLAIGPSCALMGNRFFQTLQLGVAARAAGIDAGIVQALAAQGVNLIANAVGVLVPGSLGTTDGALTLAASMLGTTAGRATSLALLLRCTQLAWLAIGSLVLMLGPRARPDVHRGSGGAQDGGV